MKLFNLILVATFTLTTANATPSSSRQITAQTIKNGAAIITLPTTTGTLCGIAESCTLTTKTINATNNTITNIDNAAIKAAAAIDATKIADGSVTSTEFQYIGTLTSDIQAQVTAITSSASSAYEISNCSIVASVAANALTINFKDSAGADPTGSTPCKIGFRNATATTGTYTQVSTTAAFTAVVVSNGSALGCTASAACTLYVYAIYTGSAVVPAVVGLGNFDEGTVQSSTAEGGAGAADTIATLYSTAAQTSKPLRLMGRITITPGASFAWSASPTEISNVPLRNPSKVNIQVLTGSGTYTKTAGVSWIRVRLVGGGGGGASGSTSGAAGSTGSDTTFGSSFLTGSGGVGGAFAAGGPGGTGGAASLGSATGIAIQGGYGNASTTNAGLASFSPAGGNGGVSPFGGAGRGGVGGAAGNNAIAGSGSGGGGGGGDTTLGSGGGGGGAGGYVEVIIPNPSVQYAYAVGGGGNGNTAGLDDGGNGGAGTIVVEEYY